MIVQKIRNAHTYYPADRIYEETDSIFSIRDKMIENSSKLPFFSCRPI